MREETKVIMSCVIGAIVLTIGKRLYTAKYEKVYDKLHVGKKAKSYYRFL